jgi:hypothetical protein
VAGAFFISTFFNFFYFSVSALLWGWFLGGSPLLASSFEHGFAVQSDLALSYGSPNLKPWQEGGRYLLSDSTARQDPSGIGVPHLAFLWTSKRESNRFRFHLRYEPNSDTPLGLVEGEYRKRWNLGPQQRLILRAGMLIPSISVEHRSKGWELEHGIRPSGLNTWVGEELRPLAIEARYQGPFGKELNWDATFALHGFNDTAGTVLAWRGWALHTHLTHSNDRLRFQTIIPTQNTPVGESGRTFVEIDQRPGVYGGVGLGKRSAWSMRLFYFDSMGDATQLNVRNEYAWDTQFINLSCKWRWTPKLELKTQGMSGLTRMGPISAPAVKNRFQAAMVQVNTNLGWHCTGRLGVDFFEVEDLDGTVDDNTSRGRAFRISVQREFGKHQVITEWVSLENWRQGNAPISSPGTRQHLFQIRYRLKMEGGLF